MIHNRNYDIKIEIMIHNCNYDEPERQSQSFWRH